MHDVYHQPYLFEVGVKEIVGLGDRAAPHNTTLVTIAPFSESPTVDDINPALPEEP